MNGDTVAAVVSIGLFLGIPVVVVGTMLLQRRSHRRRRAEGYDGGSFDDGLDTWSSGGGIGGGL